MLDSSVHLRRGDRRCHLTTTTSPAQLHPLRLPGPVRLRQGLRLRLLPHHLYVHGRRRRRTPPNISLPCVYNASRWEAGCAWCPDAACLDTCSKAQMHPPPQLSLARRPSSCSGRQTNQRTAACRRSTTRSALAAGSGTGRIATLRRPMTRARTESPSMGRPVLRLPRRAQRARVRGLLGVGRLQRGRGVRGAEARVDCGRARHGRGQDWVHPAVAERRCHRRGFSAPFCGLWAHAELGRDADGTSVAGVYTKAVDYPFSQISSGQEQ